jgi:hypothetical protein
MKQRQQQIMKQSSSFGQSKNCINGCGALIYFDKNSPTGHPNPDKWIPLEIKQGTRTDVAHNCPKGNGHDRTRWYCGDNKSKTRLAKA